MILAPPNPTTLDPFNTSGYHYLKLAVHGGTTGGQNLYAYFLGSNGSALLPAKNIGTYISDKSGVHQSIRRA